MKKISILFVFLFFLGSQIFGGVVKKTKSEVTFKKFGTLTSVQVEKFSGDKKVTDSDNKFKGKGILGGLAAKALLKSGETGEIIDLPAMTIYRLDHKKKEYEAQPIKKISNTEKTEEVTPEKESKEEEASESDIKIIRSDFKVEETGESKVINQFPSKKFTVTWVTEWENLRTGQKGTDRLLTDVWTAPLTGAIEQARKEELNFSQEYMKRLGFDYDELQQSILGTNWIQLLSRIGEDGGGTRQEASQFSKEMKKITGYPVVVDGKYFAVREGGEEQEQESGKDVKSLFGGLAKKALQKKPKDNNEPSFSYYTELIEFSPADTGDAAFQVPVGYKKKG